jgi:hypothetical protein
LLHHRNWLQRRDSNPRFLAYETKRMTTSILCDIWCPTTESNCQYLITKQVLYHLTSRAKNLVDRGGIEPPTVTCKATVFPIIPSAQIVVDNLSHYTPSTKASITGLGGGNRTPATWPQTTNDTISPHREIQQDRISFFP